MLRVLAIDPGQSVGWATATAGETYDHTGGTGNWELHVTAHGISPLKDCALAIHKAVVIEDRIDVVAYETFILTAKGARVSVGNDMQTSQFVGMVRLCAWLNPRVQLVPQGPAAKTSAMKSMRCGHPSAADVQARIQKLPKSHDLAHDGDALMHAWHWFFERYV